MGGGAFVIFTRPYGCGGLHNRNRHCHCICNVWTRAISYPTPHALTRAKSTAKNGEAELSAGIANLRTEFAELLLRMEEGELQKDQFVREVGTT